jgi:segregation and condensation protein B
MESKDMRRIIEALVLSSPEPISAEKLAEIIPYCKPGQAKDLVNELNTEYAEQDRAFEIWEVAGGFQIRTRAEFSGYLQKLQKERTLRLSQAALETLAIIAYRQPTTRAEIEEVRGVDAGATVRSLLERHLIRIAGQREVPGRPMLYGTTRRFLEVFGIENLKNLPSLRELDELAKEHGLLDPTADENAEADASVHDITEAMEAMEATDPTETNSTDVADVTTDEILELDGGELAEADEMLDEEEVEQDSAISEESDADLDADEDLTER